MRVTVPRYVRGIALMLVSVGLLTWVLSRVDLAEVGAIFAGADRWLLFAAAAFSLASFAVLPTIRWKMTLRAMGFGPTFKWLAFARFGSQPLKIVIPFKGGEAFRALWLKRREGIEIVSGAASILFDMFLVAIGQLSFLCVGLAMLGSEPKHLIIPATLLSLIAAGLTSRRLQHFGLWVAGAISTKLGALVEQLAHGFLRFPLGTKLKLVLFSYLVEFSEIFSMFLCARALGVDLPLGVVLLNMPIVMGITLIPVTISGLGTRELAIITLFAGYASPEALASVALLFTAVEFILPALVGCGFLSPFLGQLAEKSGSDSDGRQEGS